MSNRNNNSVFGNGVFNPGARPMKVVKDSTGNIWLCDADVDTSRPLANQSCWSYDQVIFERED